MRHHSFVIRADGHDDSFAIRADGSAQDIDSSRVATNSEGLTRSKIQREQVRNMKLADRLLMRRFPDGRDGLSALGDGGDGSTAQIGVARVPGTATIHATATPDPIHAHPPPYAGTSYISPQSTCSAALSNTTFHSTPPSLGSTGATARVPEEKEGRPESLASEGGREHSDELRVSAKSDSTDPEAPEDRGARRSETKKNVTAMLSES